MIKIGMVANQLAPSRINPGIQDEPANEALVENMAKLINGHRVTGIICAAARLGLADIIADDAVSLAELASHARCDMDTLARLLRALASMGIFEETPDGRFGHTAASRLLRQDSESSLHGLACMTSLMHLWVWPHLLDSVRDGRPAFESVFKTRIFEYMKDRAEVADAFDRAMGGYTEVVAESLLRSYDFSPFERIIDIGGGSGALLKRILRHYPGARGTVYDIEHVVRRTRLSVQNTSLETRIDGIAGNFFEFVPPGGDLYILKIVLCDWQDSDATRILSSIRRAIGKGKRLLIVDAVLPSVNTPCFARLSDINMLLMTGGRERNEADFRGLLNISGFTMVSIRPVHEWVSAVEAVPSD